MTLQQPRPLGQENIQPQKLKQKIFCHKCGAELTFHKDKVGPNGRKTPLDPFFNNEPHQQYCMYQDMYDPDTEPLLFDFLSMLPKPQRQRRIIGAVGKAK